VQEIGEGGIEAIEGALDTGRTLRLQGACGSKRPSIESRVEHGDLWQQRTPQTATVPPRYKLLASS
jgi:hypothetical protein